MGGDQDETYEEGKLIVFDDSFKHKVWHRGEEHHGVVFVLHVSAWHPEVTLVEREMALSSMSQTQGEGEQLWPTLELNSALQYLKSKEAKTRYHDAYSRAFKNATDAHRHAHSH